MRMRRLPLASGEFGFEAPSSADAAVQALADEDGDSADRIRCRYFGILPRAPPTVPGYDHALRLYRRLSSRRFAFTHMVGAHGW
jgi:hypothetical protein